MSHILRHGGIIHRIVCKGCGVSIQELRPLAQIIPAQISGLARNKGQAVPVMLQPNQEYKEIGIISMLPDGRLYRHITHCCKTCVGKLLNAPNPLTKPTSDLLHLWLMKDFDDMQKWEGGKADHYMLWTSGKVVDIDFNPGEA